jgi:hypothetical protein
VHRSTPLHNKNSLFQYTNFLPILTTTKTLIPCSIRSNRLIISKILQTPFLTPFKPNRSNISNTQRQLLHKFKSNTAIIITKVDKGSCTTILSTDKYISEALRQLSDTSTYLPINSDPIDSTLTQLHSICSNLRANNYITPSQLEFLIPPRTTITTRKIYFLPKIHKPIDKWVNNIPPGRPIISDINSTTYNSSKLLTQILKPFPPTLPAYIKNSKHFVSNITTLTPLPNTLLVTADIESLYTRMDLNTCTSLFHTFTNTHFCNKLSNLLTELFNLNLSTNTFSFLNQIYLQTKGVAMGKSFAPHLANLYLAKFDELAITYSPPPSCYFRYIDDIFFTWDHGLTSLTLFQNYLNNLIPDINLTFNSSTVSINFLDIEVYVTNTHFNTKIYFKPTDTHSLLSTSSFHPSHTTRGILKSQFIRFKTLCTTHLDYKTACTTTILSLLKRGYKYKKMISLSNYIWNSYIPPNNTLSNPIFLPLPFNSTNIQFSQLLKTTLSNTTLKLIIAWKKNKNLLQLTRNYP